MVEIFRKVTDFILPSRSGRATAGDMFETMHSLARREKFPSGVAAAQGNSVAQQERLAREILRAPFRERQNVVHELVDLKGENNPLGSKLSGLIAIAALQRGGQRRFWRR